jgi:DnaJ family protein C protein 7
VTALKLGQALSRLERYEEAIAALGEAVHLNPRSLSPFVERAAAYAALGRLDDAIGDLQAALALDPAARRHRARLEALLAQRDQPGMAGKQQDTSP